MASNIDLVCTLRYPIELISATESDAYSIADNDYTIFYMKVTTLSNVVCTTNGNLKLMVSWGRNRNPNNALYCESDVQTSATAVESCSSGIATGILYAIVQTSTTSVSDYKVTCTAGEDFTAAKATQLTSGTATDPVAVAEEATLYYYLDEPTATQVTCTTTATDGDVNLYMAWSDANTSVCVSQKSTAAETCKLGAGGGKAFAIVFVAAAATDFSITCTATL